MYPNRENLEHCVCGEGEGGKSGERDTLICITELNLGEQPDQKARKRGNIKEKRKDVMLTV